MGQVIYPPFAAFIRSQSWAASQVLARNAGNTGFVWAAASSGGSPATPSGAVQICGFGSSSTSFAAAPGFSSDSFGAIAIAPNVRSSGSPFTLKVTRSADLTLASGVEASGVIYTPASVQFTSGAQALLRSIQIGADTITATGSTVVTTASTLDIAGQPAAGTNVTITNPYALRVASGSSLLGGNLTVNGQTVLAYGTPQFGGPWSLASNGSGISVQSTNNSHTGTFFVLGSGNGGISVKIGETSDDAFFPSASLYFDLSSTPNTRLRINGSVGIIPPARTSGSSSTLQITPPLDTSITAGPTPRTCWCREHRDNGPQEPLP